MIYRDVTSMARFSTDIYKQPLRDLITFIIPVGVMMTFPAKALFGLLNLQMLIIATVIGIVTFGLSLISWHYALTKYTSSSS